MIRNDREYEEALRRLGEDEQLIATQEDSLRAQGFTDEQVEYGTQPLRAFREQLRDDIEWYDRVKKGDVGVLHDLTAIGRWLIGLRIAYSVSQAELARRLDVDPSLVSRDERNEYHGITVERAQRILTALRARPTMTVEGQEAGEREVTAV